MNNERLSVSHYSGDAIERFVKGINERRFDILMSAFSPDWNDHQPEGPKDYISFEMNVKSVISAFPDFAISIDERIDTDDRVILRLTMTGRHQGEFFGQRPTGKLISIRSHDIHRVVNDRIAESWQLEDWFALLEQIGGIAL